MAVRPRILILGGTGEARALADRLDETGRTWVLTSLAGRTRDPRLPAGTVRHGGFGGADGLRDYLEKAQVDLLVDATHPFAERISRHAAAACDGRATPRLTLTRPPWCVQTGDRWIDVASAADAARVLPDLGHRIFLAIGRQELPLFADRRAHWFLLRSIDPPDGADLPPNAVHVHGRGPFAEADELGLLREYAIDGLVTRNAGGAATYAKVAAARTLGLPVAMIARPAPRPAIGWRRSTLP